MYNIRERRVGLSTPINPFHTEHDPPDVISLDNNTAMLLANSKTITDDITLTSPYVSFENPSPWHPRVLARVTRWQFH